MISVSQMTYLVALEVSQRPPLLLLVEGSPKEVGKSIALILTTRCAFKKRKKEKFRSHTRAPGRGLFGLHVGLALLLHVINVMGTYWTPHAKSNQPGTQDPKIRNVSPVKPVLWKTWFPLGRGVPPYIKGYAGATEGVRSGLGSVCWLASSFSFFSCGLLAPSVC